MIAKCSHGSVSADLAALSKELEAAEIEAKAKKETSLHTEVAGAVDTARLLAREKNRKMPKKTTTR